MRAYGCVPVARVCACVCVGVRVRACLRVCFTQLDVDLISGELVGGRRKHCRWEVAIKMGSLVVTGDRGQSLFATGNGNGREKELDEHLHASTETSFTVVAAGPVLVFVFNQ